MFSSTSSALVAAWLCCGLVAAADKSCPLTVLPGSGFTCGRTGWVQDPASLSVGKAKTVDDCFNLCDSNSKCRSFRFLQGTGKCQLYSKYLVNMDLDLNNFKPGILYDRDCFSTDCNTIKACDATSKGDGCTSFSPEYSLYDQYACAYGRTAQIHHFKFNDILLDGNQSACKAFITCVIDLTYYDYNIELDGSIDLHYHIPSNKWVCRTFQDYSGPKDISVFYVYPSEEDAGHNRYTLKNASVGAGYGYIYTNEFGGQR